MAIAAAEPGADLVPFLTAFDPTDLPGGSVDPLGFDRGYNLLADKLLPGLTNVGNRPRYLSLLCAGALLAEVDPELPARKQREARTGCVLRLERLWAVAHALNALDDDGEGENDALSARGIRGITYARSHLRDLTRASLDRTAVQFDLLLRQATYGVLGIYGNIASGMRLVDRETLRPTPDHGALLGEAFLEGTAPGGTILRVARGEGEVSLKTLAQWGRRAHVQVLPGAEEARHFREALHRDPARSRMAALLADHPFEDDEGELDRLARIGRAAARASETRDLGEVIGVILPFERCYRLVVLTLDRMLWLAHVDQAGSVAEVEAERDGVLSSVVPALRDAVAALTRALQTADSTLPASERSRLKDVLTFLTAAAESKSAVDLARAVLVRHRDVQHGKVDGGRRKMPWLERRDGSFGLTLTRFPQTTEVAAPEDIRPHEYRTSSADAYLEAAGATPA